MSRRILYVEDGEDDVYFMQSAFKKIAPHVQIDVITDGRKAADYFSNTGSCSPESAPTALSLVILDLNLPGLSGIQVLEHIRTNTKCANVPVMLFSASSQQKDIDSCYAVGCNAYVVKPSDPDRLKSLVSNINEFWVNENRRSAAPRRAAN